MFFSKICVNKWNVINYVVYFVNSILLIYLFSRNEWSEGWKISSIHSMGIFPHLYLAANKNALTVERLVTWWGPLCQPTWHLAPCGARLGSAATGPAPHSDLDRAEGQRRWREAATTSSPQGLFFFSFGVCSFYALPFRDSSFSLSRQHKGLTVADAEEGNPLS